MRRVGLPVEFVEHRPGCWYPVEREVPAEFYGRGRGRPGPMHTFVDDWRQEMFWRRPQEGLLVALAAGVCTAPDFTVWVDDPPEHRRYQAWRSAVVAGYWSAHGVDVLPVVSFGSDAHRYVSPGSTWAVRAPGVRDRGQWCERLERFAEEAQAGRFVVFGVAARCLLLGTLAGLPVECRRLSSGARRGR